MMDQHSRFSSSDYTPAHAKTYAARYDDGIHATKVNLVKRFLGDIQGKEVLDLGCGVGNFSALCASMGAAPVACDFASSMVEHTAHRYSGRFPVVRGSAEAPPFATDAFDIVMAFDVIEHLYQPNAMLGSIHRLLKADGCLLLTTDRRARFHVGFIPKYIRKFLGQLRRKPKPGQGQTARSTYDTPLCTHVYEYSVREIIAMATHAGFRLSNFDTYSLRPRYSLFGRMVEAILRGPLKQYKWNYAIYRFDKGYENANQGR